MEGVNWNREFDSIIRVGKDGLIKSDLVIKENEELLIRKKKKNLTPGQIKFLNDRDDLKLHNSELGGFVVMCYVKNELLFNHLGIARANISRLIYLATFLDYSNRENGLLIKHTKDNKIQHMTRNDIKSNLRLSDRAFINFMNDVKNNNLMFEVGDKFYISDEYFTKGTSHKDDKEYTRIYIDTTRYLYENCSVRQHKQLSYIFQLTPKLNYNTNIICNNIYEKDISKLDRLGIKEICEFLQISTSSRSNITKLKQELLKFNVVKNGEKYYLFRYFLFEEGYAKGDFFVVNPMVIWKGNDIEYVKDTINRCYFF